MTNGTFKSSGKFGYARVTTVMSTQSPIDFEWSIKLVGGWFCVGITSQLKRENKYIEEYDENAIIYRSYEGHKFKPDIKIGSNIIYRDVQESGSVIRFRFQPHAKKLLIDLVRTS